MSSPAAMRLVAKGELRPLDGAQVFHARGRHGTYLVTFWKGTSTCSCPAGRRGVRCYHQEAGDIFLARETSEAAA